MQRDRKPAIREGPQYQAVVPEGPPLPRPSGSEEEDLRAGTRGPTPEEMLALAAGPEKDAASSLPPDARTDDATTANINGARPPAQCSLQTFSTLSRPVLQDVLRLMHGNTSVSLNWLPLGYGLTLLR